MKKILARLETAAKSPVVRPLEVWALRAALAYVAVKLGIDVTGLAR